jgi:hypothetical protein
MIAGTSVKVSAIIGGWLAPAQHALRSEKHILQWWVASAWAPELHLQQTKCIWEPWLLMLRVDQR